jgi:hypothetical protein
LDVRILLRTLWVMLRRDGISMEGHATAERFRGTPAPEPLERRAVADGTVSPDATEPSRETRKSSGQGP